MEENTHLPNEVVERILKARDALVVGDRDEAYHQLYGIASPKFDKYYPWGEMEKQVGHIRLNEQDIINSKEVTAYATKLQYSEERNSILLDEMSNLSKLLQEKDDKLHQANETIKELERQNEKMKSMATGWRPLLEKVLVMNEMWGDLPGEFINEVKSFLYGE